MIPDFSWRFGLDGCRSSRGGAAGGSTSLRCLFFGRSALPLEPCLTSTPGNNPCPWSWLWIVPLAIPGAGDRVVWVSPPACCHLGEAALPPPSSPPPPLAWEQSWNHLPEVIPIPGGGAQRIPYFYFLFLFWERLALAGFSSPFFFPPLSGTHSGISRALSEHCLQHLLPRQGPELCQDFFKCSLKPQNTNQVSFLLLPLPPGTASSFPVGWEEEEEGRVSLFLVRKGLYPKKNPEYSTLVLASWALFTANSKKKLPPLPVPSANSVCPPHAWLLLPSLPKTNPGEGGDFGVKHQEKPTQKQQK